MGSDRANESKASSGRQPWVAEVGRRLSPTAEEKPPEVDFHRLKELAEQASDAANKSARLAADAARASSLADLTVDRLGTAPIEQARSTALEIGESALRAAESSAVARDRSALTSHAVQIEVDRGVVQPSPTETDPSASQPVDPSIVVSESSE